MTVIMYESEELMAVRCPSCGVVHGISEGTQRKVAHECGLVYCPNGHYASYGNAYAKFEPAPAGRFTRLCCPSCGIPFGVSPEYYAVRKGLRISCPNSHAHCPIGVVNPPASPAPARIGDAERDKALARLTDAYAAGELDHDEWAGRAGFAIEAKTSADLAKLLADLPAPEAKAPAVRVTEQPRYWNYLPVAVLAVVFLIVMAAAIFG